MPIDERRLVPMNNDSLTSSTLNDDAQHVVQPLDVIAVGAHPDDVEIACGGTLAKLASQGYRVGIIDLTNGEPTPRCDDRSHTGRHVRYVAGPLELVSNA